jgi:hypothetical protein
MATIRSRVQGEMTVVENVNLRVWNVLAASKQRCEGQTIEGIVDTIVLNNRLRRMTDHAVRPSIDLQGAPRARS